MSEKTVSYAQAETAMTLWEHVLSETEAPGLSDPEALPRGMPELWSDNGIAGVRQQVLDLGIVLHDAIERWETQQPEDQDDLGVPHDLEVLPRLLRECRVVRSGVGESSLEPPADAMVNEVLEAIRDDREVERFDVIQEALETVRKLPTGSLKSQP